MLFVFPSQKDFVLAFRRGEVPSGAERFTPTDSPANFPEDPPILPIDSAIEPQNLTELVKRREFYVGDWGGAVQVPGYLKLRPTPLPGSRPCGRLYDGLMVFSNGKVGACNCRDFEASSELILGTLHDDNLDSMWRSQRLADVREGWEQAGRIPAVCQNCRHYSS